MSDITPIDLYRWCSIRAQDLATHPERRIPFRLVDTPEAMGEMMAAEFVEEIAAANRQGRSIRAIVPCGPRSWYEPFVRQVNQQRVSLKGLTVFHMDECLDWQGNLLAHNDPHNFRSCMENWFYRDVNPELAVPQNQRVFPEPAKIEEIKRRIAQAPVDILLGGWGQDGHLAYNQARRNPYSQLTLEQLRNCELRVQENNIDTLLALGHRSFGAAYQFVPPMSITLGMKECLSARKIRVFSDTGAWKQTALRIALFSPETVECPLTLLQSHPDAIITATLDTARHPISEHPEWQFTGINA